MIDNIIELTTTSTYNEDAGLWIARIKGYPVAGRGESPEEAIISARDEIQRFFELMTDRRYVSATYSPVSLKATLTVRIDSDRVMTLTEFGVGGAGGEEEGLE